MDTAAAERADAERAMEKEAQEAEALRRRTQELEREVAKLREELASAKAAGNQRFKIDDF